MVEETAYRVRTAFFPLYSEVRALLKIWPGVAKKAVLTLINALWEQPALLRTRSIGRTRTPGYRSVLLPKAHLSLRRFGRKAGSR